MSQPLDPIPVTGVFLGFVIIAFAVYELGYRFGRWWQGRSPVEATGPTEMMVGSILALLAFLLAVTMNMASERFDTRRSLVREEANTIGTTFLRAGYLPTPYGDEIQNLLRAYVPLRIAHADAAQHAANRVRSKQIHPLLWAQAEALVRNTPDSESLSLFIESLNELIDVYTTRVVARVYARVPETVILALVIGAIVTMGVVGYSAGLTTRGSLLTAVMLVVALGTILTLVIDLDRPDDGFLRVSQQPLIDLREDLGVPRQ
jgi:hypothetical protein